MTTEKHKTVGKKPSADIDVVEALIRQLADQVQTHDETLRANELRIVELETRIAALEGQSVNPLGLKQ